MRIDIIAVHRLGRAVEAGLARDYAQRATVQGRTLALGPVEIIEVEGRKPGKVSEGEAILAAAGDGAWLMACDEHGEALTSRAFADRLTRLRDAGERRLVFVLGGADGLSDAVKAAAKGKIAFGPQTWPHALARVLLAEQVYRACAIVAGAPYHRD